MSRLCLGTLINILYYNRNNNVKVDLVCDSIASSYGVDLSDMYDRNNYDKLKAGRNNTPNEIIDAARSISADKLSNGIKNNILPIIKDSKKEAIILEIRDVLRKDETIDWDATLGFDGFTKRNICECTHLMFADTLAAVLQYAVMEVANNECQDAIKEIGKEYVESFVVTPGEIVLDPEAIIITSPLSISSSKESFERAFTKIDSLNVMGPVAKSSAHIFCVEMSNQEFRFRRMQDYLFENIGRYVMSRYKVNQLKSEGKADTIGLYALREFQNAYKDKSDNVLGEMLLYIFMEQVLGAPKIMSKIELDKVNGIVSKSDGIHLYSGTFAGQPFNQIVYGAANLEEDLCAAADRALSRILDIKGNRNNELRVVENTVYNNVYDKETTEYIKSMIIPQKGHKPSNDMAFGVFLGYSIDLSKADPLTYREDAMMKMKTDIAMLKDYIRNKIISERLNGYDFYIYVIPFNDAEGEKIRLIDEMLNSGGV